MDRPRAQQKDPSRFVRVTARAGVVTATFTGPSVGAIEAPAIAPDIIAMIEKAGSSLRFLVLDLGAVTFINSAGLGLCIDLRNRAHARRAVSIAVGLNDDLTEIFEAMKIDRLFDVVADADALAARLRAG